MSSTYVSQHFNDRKMVPPSNQPSSFQPFNGPTFSFTGFSNHTNDHLQQHQQSQQQQQQLQSAAGLHEVVSTGGFPNSLGYISFMDSRSKSEPLIKNFNDPYSSNYSRTFSASSINPKTLSSPNDVHDQDSAMAKTKRPRRKYEEIERLYVCGYDGCSKGYGTLNHLNSHVQTQNHGPKRTPEQFKKIRQIIKEKKKLEKLSTVGKELVINNFDNSNLSPISAPVHHHSTHQAQATNNSLVTPPTTYSDYNYNYNYNPKAGNFALPLPSQPFQGLNTNSFSTASTIQFPASSSSSSSYTFPPPQSSIPLTNYLMGIKPSTISFKSETPVSGLNSNSSSSTSGSSFNYPTPSSHDSMTMYSSPQYTTQPSI